MHAERSCHPRSHHRSRDAFASESFRPMRVSKKSEGARDAGGPADPRAPMSRDTEAERRSRPRPPSGLGRTASPPSLQRPARGVYRLSSASPPVAECFLPTALGFDSAWPFGTELRRCRQRARDANCGAGADAASAAARWVCVLHPGAATALRSRLTTPREAPSDGPAWAQYESGKSARG